MSERGHRSQVSPARHAAREIGTLIRVRNAFAQDVIAKQLGSLPLTPEDRAFATLLVLGVVSSTGTLDEVIDRCLRSPEDIGAEVRDALRVSTYEAIFLDKSPHAAVDQGVELVRATAPRAANLANAVLRKVVAAKGEFPFGDPATDTAALARSCAFPLWLAERLIADLGVEAARAFMEASNEPAPLFVATNSLAAADGEVAEVFSKAGGSPAPVVLPGTGAGGCLLVRNAQALQHPSVKELFSEGKILVSDAASQAVAAVVLPEKCPGTLLEIGAGRATKTILLASNAHRRWSRKPLISSLDSHSFKVRLLKERTALYGVSLGRTYTGDATRLGEVVGNASFDMVFIDAPCSGLGTLRRHPEIRWRLSAEAIDKMAGLGYTLLEQAAAHVRPGGTLAFATCTVTRAENEGVVQRFLESSPGSAFRRVPIGGQGCFSTRLKSRSSDAHFAVRMERVR